MSWWQQLVTDGVKQAPSLGSLDLTGANETLKVTTPFGIRVSLLQAKNASARVAPSEIWVPLGLFYTIGTDIATSAVVTLRKNGVSPLSGGTATLAAGTAATKVLFAPFTFWRFATTPVGGDQWSILVTTTDATGVIDPVKLAYTTRTEAPVTDGIAM